jgi:hypothetical protein
VIRDEKSPDGRTSNHDISWLRTELKYLTLIVWIWFVAALEKHEIMRKKQVKYITPIINEPPLIK